jgi:hypothetical protein
VLNGGELKHKIEKEWSGMLREAKAELKGPRSQRKIMNIQTK